MPTWQQEMGWHCGTCEKLNRGRFKECQNCGKAKESEPFVDLPDEGEGLQWAVTDAKLLEQAEAGPDWECRFCASHQRRDNGDCANCGAKQGESRNHETKWDDGSVGPSGEGLTEREEIAADIEKDLTLSDTEPGVYEAILDAEAKERRAARISTGSYRKHTPAPVAVDIDPEPSWRPERRRFWSREVRLVTAAVLGVISLVFLGYFLFRTRLVNVAVATVHWEHKVSVERQQIVRDEGFAESKPSEAFDVESLGSRHHHDDKILDGYDKVPYEDRYQCGETCTTTPRRCSKTPVNCTSNKNGFKSCSGGDERCTGGDRSCTPKYCTRTKYREVPRYHNEPVYRTFYQWHVWRWVPNRVLVESGADNDPFWPSDTKVGLGDRERANRSSSYEVIFEGPDHDKHNYTPKSLDEFRRLTPGTIRQLKVRIIGANELVP